MADNWSSWYSGGMAPPLKLPGGGYAPAPSAQPQMTPEEMYQGIYGEPLQMTSRTVKSAPINPSTGMPYATTANASAKFGGGIAAGGRGEVRYSPPVYQPDGTVVENKNQSRLPATPAGMPLTGTYASAKAGLGAGGAGSGTLTANAPAKSSGVISLSFEPMSEVSGQNMANSAGRPVSGPSGKVYYPSDAPMSGVRAPYDPGAADKYVRGSMSAKDARGPLSQLLGLKTSGLGGLLGGLFGGGQQQGGGGGLAAMLGGGAQVAAKPAYVTTPFQEDRFQTTTGAVMPSSMNNSRWTTGY